MAKHKHIITILCLCALVFILFGGTIRHGFNSDDYLVVDHALRDPTSSPAGIFGEFARPSWGLYYRPIIKFFFETLARAFALAPAGYHLASLICYAILCLEVYIISLLLTEKWHISAAAAIIFMTSASHGEALFWISSLNGAVENIFTLAALLFFVLWRQKGKPASYAFSLVLFAAALLTKESAISLPIILVLYDFLLGGENRWVDATKRTAKSCWPFAALGFGFLLLRALVMRHANLPPPLVAFEWRLLLAGPWHSIVMTLSPIDWRGVLRWFDVVTRTPAILYLAIATILLALTIVPLALRRFKIAFLILWVIAAAAPLFALGLVPSERHVVFGSAGAAVLLAIVFFEISTRIAKRTEAASVAVGFVLAGAFAIASCYSLKQAQDSWRHASIMAGDIVEQTMAAYPDPAENTIFFFLDVPDSIEGAFVFRFDNLQTALRLYYGDDSIKAVRVATLDRARLGTGMAWQAAYFNIAAMGGNIHVPKDQVEGPDQSTRWRNLSELGILGKDFLYIDKWEEYRSSPFLAYSSDGLKILPPDELKQVVDSLYTLR